MSGRYNEENIPHPLPLQIPGEDFRVNGGGKSSFDSRSPGDLEERLLSPDHFDRRLSADSKLSSFSHDSAKGLSGHLNPDDRTRPSFSSLHYGGRLSPAPPADEHGTSYYAPSPSRASKIVTALQRAWFRNRGVLLVALSQLFGALMNLSARLLELEGGMHPFQVLFARQSLTLACCVAYMYWKKTPDFPFGAREVRWLLMARGFFGFFGIYGMWYSIMYLPLAEATVITFLAPSFAGIACYLAFGAPFTRVEKIGTLVAFIGVVLIAHPTSLFSLFSSSSSSETTEASTATTATTATSNSTSTEPEDAHPGMEHVVTAAERFQAVGVALIGVIGAAGAFTCIRWIGKRAHPLLSVNYFATWCTVVSLAVLTIAPALDIGQPGLRFALPQGIKQWTLLIFLGVMGFIMQFMLTAGLRVDRSNRANAMVFTHMLFAAGFDKWVFGTSMGWMSLAGCGLIIGAALYMVLTKDAGGPRKEDAAATAGQDLEGGVRDAEAVPMLMDMDREDDEFDEDLDARRTPLGG